jgi:hypothetical protein
VEAALLEELVAGLDVGGVEPPLLAAEDQVASGDATDAGRLRAMPVVHADAEGLRRHDAAEPRVAREVLVPMEGVGMVHRHDPAADVGDVAGLAELTPADGLAHPVVDIAQIELRLTPACAPLGHVDLLPVDPVGRS